MLRNFFLLFVILVIGPSLSAQMVIPLSSNPALEHAEQKDFFRTKQQQDLQLPFVEDFSHYSGYPDPSLWEDRTVYVNQEFAIYPPTVGVATFDGLNARGEVYPHASTQPFYADTLTSKTLRMDSLFGTFNRKLEPKDSVYFSFYFQPGGGYGERWKRMGVTPQKGDSLSLEFYDYQRDTWNRVWATAGFSLDELHRKDSVFFKYVQIPIVENHYFSEHFRFRFRNIGSLPETEHAGFVYNCGQWHVDYIYIDVDRTQNEQTVQDIAFVSSAPSFLKRYQAMPARQFSSSEMADSFHVRLSNLYHADLSSRYKYEIYDEAKVLLHSYEGGVENIAPFFPTQTYQTKQNHAHPGISYLFQVNPDTWKTFELRHLFQRGGGSSDQHPQNDTIRFVQRFQNYFAYDDGSPEGGFGITSPGSFGLLYEMRTADTLVAVDIFFNKTLNQSSSIPFDLCIWSVSEDNQPDQLLLRTQNLTPQYRDRNRFQRCVLDSALVLPQGKFLVAIEQRSATFMNVGFDLNNNSSKYIRYNVGGGWEGSFLLGSLMMRPYFGQQGTVELPTINKKNLNFTIYPNPTANEIQINTGDRNTDDLYVMIYNMLGQEVMRTKYRQAISVAHLAEGVYLVRLSNSRSKSSSTKKLIIRK